MKARTVGTIFRKEMIDTLRDRRTLISMLAIPILAIPLLMVVTSRLVVSQVSRATEEPSKVVVMGIQHLPADLRSRLADSGELVLESVDGPGGDREAVLLRLREGLVHAAIVVPEGFDVGILEETPVEIEVAYDEAEIASELASDKIRSLLDEYSEAVVSERLESRRIPGDVILPFKTVSHNVASASEMTGERVGGMLPYLVILMCFIGAMYPAIDLVAGEKERGTLETLLVSPASRGEFVAGKYLVVLTTGVIAAVLSLASMIVSLAYMGGMFGDFSGNGGGILDFDFNVLRALLVMIIVVPTAGLFGGVLLTVSAFARSFKEAQNYITAIMMAILFPAFISFLPGMKMSYKIALIPIVNISVLMKDTMFGTVAVEYVLTTVGFTILLAVGALLFTRTWFKRESVLFRM
jgi:sodium transport system permease protein